MTYNHPTEIPESNIKFKWTGTRTSCKIEGIHGDTYPITWASDNKAYMSSGDPNWCFKDGVPTHYLWKDAIADPQVYPHVSGLDIEELCGVGKDLIIKSINTMPGFTGPGGYGAKPTGMICVDGVLYLAAQNLLGKKPCPISEKSQHGSDATIIKSKDFGKTWTPDITPILTDLENNFYDREAWVWKNTPEERASWKGWSPMFPGSSFGGPSFVQFGKNNEHARDDQIYALSSDQWDNGSSLRLGRVHKQSILDPEAWSWAVYENNKINWIKSLEQSKPVLTVHNHISLPEMIYIPTIKRYLLLSNALHSDFNTDTGSKLYILESENPWGPFNLVYYEDIWESVEACPYNPRIPLKWFDYENLTGWLLHSGNWMIERSYGTAHYKAHTKPFALEIQH